MTHEHALRFFFFQAEDGIRDKLVTGVQTCALPIYPTHHLELSELAADEGPKDEAQSETHPDDSHATGATLGRGDVGDVRLGHGDVGRSEERRVGKECRTGWTPDQQNKAKRVAHGTR